MATVFALVYVRFSVVKTSFRRLWITNIAGIIFDATVGSKNELELKSINHDESKYRKVVVRQVKVVHKLAQASENGAFST